MTYTVIVFCFCMIISIQFYMVSFYYIANLFDVCEIWLKHLIMYLHPFTLHSFHLCFYSFISLSLPFSSYSHILSAAPASQTNTMQAYSSQVGFQNTSYYPQPGPSPYPMLQSPYPVTDSKWPVSVLFGFCKFLQLSIFSCSRSL